MQIPISDIYLDKQKQAQIFLLKITKREKKLSYLAFCAVF